jgi:hypothetical protein
MEEKKEVKESKSMHLYKNLATFFISIVIFLGAFTLIQYQSTMDSKKVNEDVLAGLKDNEWAFINGKIHSLRDEAKATTDLIAANIKRDILNYYGNDKKKLTNDLKNFDSDHHPIVNIFAKNIVEYYLNGVQSDGDDMWIGSRTGVISDFSVDCSSLGRTRTYEVEATLHSSPELATQAITRILKLDSSLNGWQFTVPEKPEYTVDNFTEANLRSLYEKYGLEALASFEFLVTSYIDNRQDLKGEFLVDERGMLQNNGQIIVNQGFKLVNQLKNDQEAMVTLKNFSAQKELYISYINYGTLLKEVLMIATFAMTILIFIIGTTLLNNRYELIIKEEGECKETESEE